MLNFHDPLNLSNIKEDKFLVENEHYREPSKAIVTVKKHPFTVRAVPIPFYLMKSIEKSDGLTGKTNLLTKFGLESTYRKMGRKDLIKKLDDYLDILGEDLDLPGFINNSSLNYLIDHPPICGKEIRPLPKASFAGFRLNPGNLPIQYQPFTKRSSIENQISATNLYCNPAPHNPQAFIKLMAGERDVLGTETTANNENQSEIIPGRRKFEQRDKKRKKL